MIGANGRFSFVKTETQTGYMNVNLVIDEWLRIEANRNRLPAKQLTSFGWGVSRIAFPTWIVGDRFFRLKDGELFEIVFHEVRMPEPEDYKEIQFTDGLDDLP
jgi:hypothetical protein